MQTVAAMTALGVALGALPLQSPPGSTLDLDSLPTGPAPAISWYADGEIHRDDPPLRLDGGSVGGFTETAGGYAVRFWIGDTTDDALEFVTDERRTTLDRAAGDTHDLFGPVTSPDGSLVAWSGVDGLDGDMFSTRLVVAEGATGEVKRIRVLDDDLRPVGFAGADRLVLRRGTAPGAATWDLTTDEITPWEGADTVTAVSANEQLAAVVTGEDASGAPCTTVVDLEGGRDLWRTCELRVRSFSPDGLRALAVSDDTQGTYARVVRSRTGEPLAQVNVGGDATAAWEDAGHLLMSVWEDGRQALVRWEVVGDRQYVRPPLELAAPPRQDGGYVLPRQ